MTSERAVHLGGGALFALVGLVLISLSNTFGEREREFEHALTTTGTIVNHHFDREPGSEGGFQTTLDVSVEYRVGGKVYTAKERVDDLAPFPIGKVIQVYYSPDHPNDAALEKPSGSIALLLFGGAVALIGAALIISGLRGGSA